MGIQTVHMLWVERDLSAIVKAIFERWDSSKDQLLYKYLYAMDAVRTPNEICATIERGKLDQVIV